MNFSFPDFDLLIKGAPRTLLIFVWRSRMKIATLRMRNFFRIFLIVYRHFSVINLFLFYFKKFFINKYLTEWKLIYRFYFFLNNFEIFLSTSDNRLISFTLLDDLCFPRKIAFSVSISSPKASMVSLMLSPLFEWGLNFIVGRCSTRWSWNWRNRKFSFNSNRNFRLFLLY